MEWIGVWRRLLQLYKEHCPEELAYWKVHFKRIQDLPSVTAEDWAVWVAYNAEIRKLRVTNPLDLLIFHNEIWNRLYIRSLRHQAAAPSKPKQEWTSNKQSSARSSARNTRTNSSGQVSSSFRVCILCGCTTYSTLKCTETKLANNSSMYLQRGADGSWGDSSGKHVCFCFNSASRRRCISSLCPNGDHRCSLCGKPAHNAQQCSVQSAT
jgi:hypothetical protein